IHEHNGMGAFEGLQRLGVDVWPKCDLGQVTRAFTGLYSLLEDKLSVDDQNDLGFSPIFLEHFFCKVTRWEKTFDNEGPITLETIAVNAVSEETDSYPIPLVIERSELLQYFV
ncbi:hypothetical protein K435DRAFT_702616, partial [Dendrothele bispora CBS 962.96]